MLDNFFKLSENGTDFKTEIAAGITTFLAMAYILGINPVVLSDGGMPAADVFFATAVSSAVACFIMGLFGIIAGSAISGFSTNNSTKYALIYGAIVGLICSFTMLTVFTIPIFIILGLFGGFIGKVIQSNME